MTDPQPVAVAPLDRRVRIWSGGRLLADSTAALRVVEDLHEVRYYFPAPHVDPDALGAPTAHPDLHGRGPATVWDVRSTGVPTVPGGAWGYALPRVGRPDLRGHVSFGWPAMDRMVEEEQEVSVHPRHPHVRVDVLRSSRAVGVRRAGRLLAASDRPLLLLETGVPPRWYLPAADVRVGLRPGTARTECPYKGLASHWSTPHDADLAWSYPDPLDPAVRPAAGAVCFAPDRVDLVVDGVPQLRPAPAVAPAHLVGDWVRAGR